MAGRVRLQRDFRSALAADQAHEEAQFSTSRDQDKKKRKKKTALVICRGRKQFWTTQTQFWQWMREGIVVKTDDNPLTGMLRREHERLMVLIK